LGIAFSANPRPNPRDLLKRQRRPGWGFGGWGRDDVTDEELIQRIQTGRKSQT